MATNIFSANSSKTYLKKIFSESEETKEQMILTKDYMEIKLDIENKRESLSIFKKSYNCYICGCVLNCKKYLINIFNNIFIIGKLFNNYKIIIAYDESNDESLNILLDYQKKYGNIQIIMNKNEKSLYKTENIKNARNSILNFIKSDVDNELYSFFIMMDFDDVCEKEININVLEKYLYNNNWDSLSFNRYNYYDIWALSIEPFISSCWHWSVKQSDSLYVTNIMKNYIKNKLESLKENELLECYSAFNGFAIYRTEKFINCVYNNNIFNSLGKIPINLIQNNIDKLNDITAKNNSLHIYFLEDCEHRSFHLDAMFNYGARNRISPLYLFDDSSEIDCKYVSSRGILKSCTIKSATPISSINQLINYDFTTLTDGISIYVCNYALSHFLEIFDQIKCKIILVSGDSDCLIPYEIFKNHESFLAFIESEKIIHWYTQNCIIDHPKISKIPIGIDYHSMSNKDSDWGKKISPIMQEKILENIKNSSLPFYERKIKCYANFHFSMDTKYSYDRKDAFENINKDLVFYEHEKIDRELTWRKQIEYTFSISPHGNGLDCHRTWEALILGCIPIIKRCGLSKLFDDLPVLIVENWNNINNELLINTVNNFKDKVFNYNKLLLSYWNNKININNITTIKTKLLTKDNISLKNLKIYVIHYTPLIERKKHILIQFEKQNITNYEFIEKYNKEDLNECDKVLFDKSIGESMMSLMNKHFYIYKLIAKNYENSLILEDDVVLCDNFNEILNKYINQLPNDYDMLFIGDGCNLHIEANRLTQNKNIYEKCLYPTIWGGDGASRCTDSYIISKKCAIKLCNYISKLSNKIIVKSDFWLNIASRDNNLKVYWAEPTIVTQGTSNGLFYSSIILDIKILIAHYNEDLIWTKNLKYNYTIISKNGIKYEIIPNKGNEASSYLQYIIENYNNLANYTFFIHGHRNSWHHKENIDKKINNIIIKHDYYNLNDQNITTTYELSQRENNEYKIIIELIPILENIINKKIDFEKIKYRSCAQFYVSKKNILLNEINIYKKLYEFIMSTNISSYFISRLFEYTWHFIFTHNLEDIE